MMLDLKLRFVSKPDKMDDTVQKIPRDLFVDNLNNFNNLTQVQKVHSKTFL